MRAARYRSLLSCLALLLLFPTAASAEVLLFRDGSILVGTAVGAAGAGKVVYSIAGAERRLDANAVLEVFADAAGLAGREVEAQLADGSRVRGKVSAFDESALTLEAAFGPATLAAESLVAVVDPAVKAAYAGPGYALKAGGGGYAALLDGASRFGPSYSGVAGAAWSVPGVRGVYAGFELSFSAADYLLDDAEYPCFCALRAELSYRFLGRGSAKGLAARLVPFVALAAGPAYVAVEAESTNPSSYGNLTADIGAAAGLECSIGPRVALRLEGRADVYIQSGIPFITAGGLFSMVYKR